MENRGRKLQTVDNALRLLMHMAGGPDSWSITQLSRDLGLAKSVVHSLLNTLRAWGFVDQDAESRYRLGLQLLGLGEAVQSRLAIRQVALPELRRLALDSDESAYLMVLSGHKGVLVERADPPNPMRVTMQVGEHGDLHAGSSHKVMLAFLTPEEIDRYIAATGLPRLTPWTTTDPDRLRRELADIRQQGFAYTEQESFEGIAGIAAPILDRRGAVTGSIGLAGLIQRLQPRYRELTPGVIAAAAEISRSLGYGVANGR